MAKALSRKKHKVCAIDNRYTGWCPLTGGKQWLERINAECISAKQFYNRYVKRRMPVILTSSNTECLKAFSIEALSSICGDCDVAVEKADVDSFQPFGRTDAQSRMNMKFSEFLSRMQSDELYCSTQPLAEDAQGPVQITSPHVQRLIDRGMIPESLPLMGNLGLHQINAWIGCSEDGASSGFHHDFHDNFYLLISGEKQFRISSPNFAATRPTFGCKAGQKVVIHPNGLISYVGDLIRSDGASIIDVLKWKIRQGGNEALQEELEEAILTEMIDSIDPKSCASTDQPPSFCIESTAHGEYISETLKAGEMLYLPAGFFHEVISFNTSVDSNHHLAINYWYYPPTTTHSFEEPYEDNYWEARWERIQNSKNNPKYINRDRMRRNKLPLQFQYSKKEILRFIRRIEAVKKSI